MAAIAVMIVALTTGAFVSTINPGYSINNVTSSNQSNTVNST